MLFRGQCIVLFASVFLIGHNAHANTDAFTFLPQSVSSPSAYFIGLQTDAQVSVHPGSVMDSLFLSTSLPLADHAISREYTRELENIASMGSIITASILDYVRATENNMPSLHAMVQSLSDDLDLKKPMVLVFKGSVLSKITEHCGYDYRCNAFAFGCSRLGFICIGEDLIKHLSYNELEGVVAHELSHLACNHIPKRIMLGIPVILLMSLLLSPFDSALGLFDEAAQTAILMSGFKYLCRTQEVEADLTASSVIENPNVLTQALYKIEALFSEKKHYVSDFVQRFVSTHPLTKDRKQYLALAAKKKQAPVQNEVLCSDIL